MKKSELLNWLQEEHQKWEEFLDQIDPMHMDQPGVNGDWSMKDIAAHLTGWHRWVVDRLQAAVRGEPKPPSPWPAQLQTEAEINAWIHESNRARSVGEVRDETHQVFQELFSIVADLPDGVRIDKEWHLVWLGDQYFPTGEFFDHFRDDHEPDVRAWLARVERQ
jgi:hypothetical protein